MKKPILYRRLVYVFFVVLFLIVSPLVILYSQGYRYNVKKGLVQKTGILVARSDPRGATVLIDDQSVDQTTPAKVEDILPGDYNVTITKDGYHSWHKRLTIRDNSTTFADDIILFQRNDPKLLISSTTSTWINSPNHAYVGLITAAATNTVQLLNTATGRLTTSYQAPIKSSIELINWSPTNKKLLVRQTEADQIKYIVISVNELWQTDPQVITRDYQMVNWHQDDDSLIYGWRAGQIFSYDLTTDRETLLGSSEKINNLSIIDDQLVTRTGDYLTWSLDWRDASTTPDQLPACTECLINPPLHKLITVYHPIHNYGIIINPALKKSIAITAAGFDWLDNGWLLGHDKWELWTYDRRHENIETITRLSTPITAAIWHPAGRHVIIATDGKIQIIELDNRDLRNVITLTEARDVTGLTINPRNQTIYFTGTVGDQTGVFALPLED